MTVKIISRKAASKTLKILATERTEDKETFISIVQCRQVLQLRVTSTKPIDNMLDVSTTRALSFFEFAGQITDPSVPA